MIGSLEQLIHFLFNVRGLIEWGGTLLVCTIVFVETGFFVGFFLPGDSLLVTAGVFAATGHLHLVELMTLVPLCAIVGDQIGYWIGRKAGQALYRREDSLIFRRRHLDRRRISFTRDHGGKTVNPCAVCPPLSRTFCPPVRRRGLDALTDGILLLTWLAATCGSVPLFWAAISWDR